MIEFTRFYIYRLYRQQASTVISLVHLITFLNTCTFLSKIKKKINLLCHLLLFNFSTFFSSQDYTNNTDSAESRQVAVANETVYIENLSDNVKSGLRTIKKDLDSLICVSKRCVTFCGGNGRLDYPVKDIFPVPELNTKVTSILTTRENIPCRDDFRWSVMRFANFGIKSVYFSVYHHKSLATRSFRNKLTNEVVKPALEQCLTTDDDTATQPSLNFNEYSGLCIRIYRKDSTKVTKAIDQQLSDWKYLKENDVQHYYFYSKK